MGLLKMVWRRMRKLFSWVLAWFLLVALVTIGAASLWWLLEQANIVTVAS